MPELERSPATDSKERRKRADGYVIVPAAWHKILDRTTYPPTLQIARHLLAIGGGNYNGRELYFTRWDALLVDIGRDARARALHELVQLGLIELHHVRGTTFKIILLRTE